MARAGHRAGYPSGVTTARKTAKAPMPTFIPPMLATLVAAPFDDPGWQFEVKWDGFRVEAVIDGGDGPAVDPRPAGRRAVLRAVPGAADLDRRRARPIVDGEVIALDDRGEPDFALLQARIKGQSRGGAANPFVYEVFDLLLPRRPVPPGGAARGRAGACWATSCAPTRASA